MEMMTPASVVQYFTASTVHTGLATMAGTKHGIKHLSLSDTHTETQTHTTVLLQGYTPETHLSAHVN